MFVSHTWEEQFFELLAEIAVTVAYPHEAGLNDVGHNLFVFVRLSTLIVWKKLNCYMSEAQKY